MTDWKYEAEKLDNNDSLALFRERFRKSDKNLIYLDGNSLGMMPVETAGVMNDVVSVEWGDNLIAGWNSGWWNLPSEAGKLVSALVGARGDEVIVCDSTSVNLFKLLSSALKLNPGRHRIVSDELNFPSDLYVLQGVIDHEDNDYTLELARSHDGKEIGFDELDRLIDEDTAVVVLTHVCYKSGFMYDMDAVTKLAHSKGALIIWDLCHSVGAVDIQLNSSDADMAVGCTYKYLNGGPGAPSFLYVRKDLQEKVVSPVWGWLGDNDPFEFSINYKPAEGIRRFLAGTPAILSLSALIPSLRITSEAGMEAIRTKSVLLTSFLYSMAVEKLVPVGFLPGSPSDASKRGSHVSLRHPEGYRICKALVDPVRGGKKVIPDFRPPDNIRFGLAPLYNSYMDIYYAVSQVEWIASEEIYKEYDQAVEGVT